LPPWPYRYQLSFKYRLRRSVYEVLRDQMDGILIDHALIDSYRNFIQVKEPYPFVAMRELKPRARIIEKEYLLQNHFLIIFCEGTIPGNFKKYIRFFDSNKISKEIIREQPHLTFHRKYQKNLRYFDSDHFPEFIIDLSPVDYALLVQQDPVVRRQNKYMMTHYHVRIDWPIDDATEDMAQQLRYVSKELYERGEKYAQHLHNKLFELYGFHHTVGGRRTAAVTAAQLLKKMDFISTVYVASSESRTLTRLSERGVSKYVLVKIPRNEMFQLADSSRQSFDRFCDHFMVDIGDDFGVGILHVAYRNSPYSKPPEDNKLRKLRSDYQWLSISDQLLLPLRSFSDVNPIPYSIVYSAI